MSKYRVIKETRAATRIVPVYRRLLLSGNGTGVMRGMRLSTVRIRRK
jgi:hypothetical protein